ncbi:hypothetical protein Tsubulata_026338, partial [Turnera subulata]
MFSLFYGHWKYIFSETLRVLILGIDKSGKTTLLEKLKAVYSNFKGLPPDRLVPTVGLNLANIEASNRKLIFWDLGGQPGLRPIWEKYYEESHAMRVLLLVFSGYPGNTVGILVQNFESTARGLRGRTPEVDFKSAEFPRLVGLESSPVLVDFGASRRTKRGHWSKYAWTLVQYPVPNGTYVIDASCPSRFEDSKSALEKVLRHDDLQGAPLLILANKQDLPGAVSAEELARYLALKKLDERVFMFEAVSGYNGLGIKESVEWLVEVMEQSKRTELLRARVGVTDVGA